MVKNVADNLVWPRPVIVPIPESDSEVSTPYLSLNGKWKLSENPPGEYWSNTTDTSQWDEVVVPSELFGLGYERMCNVGGRLIK